MQASSHLSVNALSQPILDQLITNAGLLNIKILQHASGATIIDAGINVDGSLEAGRCIAEICMGGLGQVQSQQNQNLKKWQSGVYVESQYPVLACLGSQYAGWALSHEKFFSLGSGPARSIARREELFQELAYQDSAKSSVLVLETDQIPPSEIISKVARDTHIKTEHLTFILTPTKSMAGAMQIVSRVLEVALHKVHTLHFPLNNIIKGCGTAPLPPKSKDFLTAMGRTNDAILFGGFVQLTVTGSDAAAQKLARDLPSSASKDYGRPFAEVFKSVNMDFYQIDPMLFSPAQIEITNIETGNIFIGGKLDEALLNLSFTD